jgi:acetylornithine deacetylase/succinyl-diaminopimelate desuccinylase-like protein
VSEKALGLIEQIWSIDIEPALHEYIRIPNVSPAFDSRWADNGHMHRAVELIRSWCEARPIDGMTVEVHNLPDRTPMIVIEVPAANGGSNTDTVLLYGHLDKQPEMTGWRPGLGPWTPVVENGRLYGRGGADDGYSAFASLAAIEVAQSMGLPHNRCVVLIEASEESGSPDLPAHLLALRDRIGEPSLVMCLDSGCLDDQRLWVTTSLRGLAACTLTVKILTEGIHSGEASGIVPSSFRIIRQLLDRIEDAATGRILLSELHVDIPPNRRRQAELTAAEFPDPTSTHYPFVPGARPSVEDGAAQLLAHTWEPTLSVTGVAGIPDVSIAGNVLRPYTSLQLSFRLPPTCDDERAAAAIERALTADPPYHAHVTVTGLHSGPGWNAPAAQPWLAAAIDTASNEYFGNNARGFGEGGTIPFMGMLGKMFPEAQFVITGVLGPDSNAHGPNEYLDLMCARKVTGCLARIMADHANRHHFAAH